jgi:hypothetical protein
LCGAHINRELAAADEAHPGQLWPIQARDASLALNIAAHRAPAAGQEHIPPEIAQFYLTLLAIERLADLARARRARAGVSR